MTKEYIEFLDFKSNIISHKNMGFILIGYATTTWMAYGEAMAGKVTKMSSYNKLFVTIIVCSGTNIYLAEYNVNFK